MKENNLTQNIRKDYIVGALTIPPLVFWTLVFWVPMNVYKYAVVGAVYELVWFPMILVLFAIPIASTYFWAKDKWNLKTFYPFCIAICLVYILFGFLDR